jgi:hypothetical protein
MSNENIAPPDLRLMIRALRAGTGLPNSLQNINTTKLPDGASCYVIEDAAFWVLDKGSSTGAITGEVLVPGSGPGRWFRQSTSSTQAPGVQVVSSDTNNGYNLDDNWQISAGANFALLSSGVLPGFWALTALGPILTYSGKTRPFLARLTATVVVGDATAPREIFAGISYNNDLTGVAALGAVGQQSIELVTANVGNQLSTERIVVMADTDTVRAKLAGPAAAAALTATSYSLSLTPL